MTKVSVRVAMSCSMSGRQVAKVLLYSRGVWLGERASPYAAARFSVVR